MQSRSASFATSAFTLFIISLMCSGYPSASHAAFDSANFNKSKKELKILRITPAGKDVGSRRQIVFKFNQPVVPIGRMERKSTEIPISIQPSLKCEWRWLNTSSLACLLNNNTRLKAATRYKLTIKPGIKTIKGAGLKKTIRHQFITTRPKTSYAQHRKWRSPTKPVLQLYFNQKVFKSSVRGNLYFEARGKRYAIIVKRYHKKQNSLYASAWLVEPVHELPADTTIKLMVEPGLLSQSGSVRGVQRKVVTTLQTYPQFKFAGINCRVQGNKTILINKLKLHLKQKCSPDYSISLQFTAPFAISTLTDTLKVLPNSKQWAELKAKLLKQRYRYNFSLSRSHRKGQGYHLAISSATNADTLHTIIANHRHIKDIFGRTLKNNINLKIRTGDYRPRLTLPTSVSVLEQGISPLLYITSININKIVIAFKRYTSEYSKRHKHTLVPESAKNKYTATTLNIKNLTGVKSGVIAGKILQTKPSVRIHNNRYDFFTQITPWHAHMKFGHFNSLLWVTHLKTGQAIQNANIEIIKGSLFSSSKQHKVIARGTSDKNGLVNLPGMNKLDPGLTKNNNYYRYNSLYFARITKGKSIAILPFTYDFHNNFYSIRNNGGNEHIRRPLDYTKAWGLTAQGVYKPGDKIDFKLFVRSQNNLGLSEAPSIKYTLRIMDPQYREVYKNKNIKLTKFGSFSGNFKTLKTSKSGWYRFQLKGKGVSRTLTPMTVLVTDFTPAPFRVSAKLNANLYQTGDTIKLTTESKLHAGGPYANGQTRITARLTHSAISSNDPKTRGFRFSNRYFSRRTLKQIASRSSEKGIHHFEHLIKNSYVVYGKIETESAVRDERGKYVTTRNTSKYAGRDRYIGLKLGSWILKQNKPGNIHALIIDEKGEISTDNKFNLVVKYKETSVVRKKNADGVLESHYSSKWVAVKEYKQVSRKNANTISFTPPKAGYYKFVSTVSDTKARTHSSTIHGWASGKGRVFWKPRPGFKLDVTPEANHYKVGDTARFMIRNPFPGAKALVTVERNGIIKKWVTTFKNSIEILKVPVKADYLPGFYVSVVVMAPRRVSKDKNSSLAPAFRIGYARIEVKDPYKRLIIKVKTDKKAYKPRDTIRVSVNVKARHGKTPKTEIAIAVLDESVFDLITQGKAYYDPYTGLYRLEGLGLQNFNLLQKLIAHKKNIKKKLLKVNDDKEESDMRATGRMAMAKSRPMEMRARKKSKAMRQTPAPGKAGPAVTVRNIFKYLSYWNGNIHPDAKGNAKISFKAPDNLTGWRVLAIAVDKSQLMGLGEGSFKVNLPLEIRPALPNQVTEGDQFTARFSIMNRTNKKRKVTLTLIANGNIKGKSKTHQVSVIAHPYKRITAGINVQATTHGDISFTAKAVSGKLGDATKVRLNVHRLKSVEVSASYGTSAKSQVSELVKLPDNIRTDIGRIAVTVSASVLGHLESAFTYLQHYPYACWEQKLTKGVMASHYTQLKPWLPKKSSWKQSRTLPTQTLAMASSHQAPNGGMTFYVPNNRYVSPYLSAYTAIAFNWLRSHGHKIPAKVETRLHKYLLTLIRRNRFPSYYKRGMSSTVRAIALAALALHGKITRRDVLKYMPHVQSMTLFGKAHFLQALIATNNTSAEQTKVMNIIHSMGDETSGKYVYSEPVKTRYGHLLYSATRTQCAILSSMLAYENKKENQSTDIPFKLMRAITAERKRSGRWNNTQDNMFCMSAIIDYAKTYEKVTPDMLLTLLSNNNKMGTAKLKGFRASPRVITQALNKIINKSDKTTKTIKLTLQRKGKGRYYYNTRLHYSLKKLRNNAVNSGISIRREYSVERKGKWILLKSPMKIQRGELVRVDLFLDLPAARNFVVVDDPIPGGLEPVNTQLATASRIDAAKAKTLYAKGSYWYQRNRWRSYGYSYWSFYHKELLHHAARYYSEYLPAGQYHLSYVAQAIAPGKFTVMPSHTEEMYSPETYGKSKPGVLIVTEEKK